MPVPSLADTDDRHHWTSMDLESMPMKLRWALTTVRTFSMFAHYSTIGPPFWSAGYSQQ